MPFRKASLSVSVAAILGITTPNLASALLLPPVMEFSFDGWFSMIGPAGTMLLNPDSTGQGFYGARSAVSGTMSFDLNSGAGSGTLVPFSFFGGGAASASGLSFQAVGDGMMPRSVAYVSTCTETK